MAFVFLNRYLDLTEAMDDPDAGPLENADFVDTDIPFDFTIPDAHFITEAMREEVDTASCIHSFIRSFVHSFVRSFIHSFIHAFTHSFIQPHA